MGFLGLVITHSSWPFTRTSWDIQVGNGRFGQIVWERKWINPPGKCLIIDTLYICFLYTSHNEIAGFLSNRRHLSNKNRTQPVIQNRVHYVVTNQKKTRLRRNAQKLPYILHCLLPPKNTGPRLMIPVQNHFQNFFVEGTASEKKLRSKALAPEGRETSSRDSSPRWKSNNATASVATAFPWWTVFFWWKRRTKMLKESVHC